MNDLYKYLLEDSTINSLLFNNSAINDKLEKERFTSIYYARAYYYLIYIQFFADSEFEIKFQELSRDILLDPNVFITPPDYSTAQIFPITLRSFHSDPLPAAKYLLSLLSVNKPIYSASQKMYIPKNFIPFCNFPAVYGYFIDSILSENASNFLKKLISLSQLGFEDPLAKQKEGYSDFPKLKINPSLSTSDFRKITDLDEIPSKEKPRYSNLMAQTVHHFVLSFLLSSFSFTEVLWHLVNEKIGKMVFIDYSSALKAIKLSVEEASPLLPFPVVSVLDALKTYDASVALDVVYDYLMVTFLLWQKQDEEGLTFTCSSTVFRVLSTQHSSFADKIYNTEVVKAVCGTTRMRRNSFRNRDETIMKCFLKNSQKISVLPNCFNTSCFGNFVLCVSYFDMIIYSKCFCTEPGKNQKVDFKQKLQKVLNVQYPKMKEQRKHSPFLVNYYPNWTNIGELNVESPFFEKYANDVNLDDFCLSLNSKSGDLNPNDLNDFLQNTGELVPVARIDKSKIKNTLNEQINRFECLIEKRRNLDLSFELNSTLNHLRKNAFSYVLSCHLAKTQCKKLDSIFKNSLKLSSALNPPSSLFLPIFQTLINELQLPDNFIPKKLRNLFTIYQENITKNEWEEFNDYKGNKYLFQIASMLTSPRIGKSMGDAFKLFNFLFGQCAIVAERFNNDKIDLSSMISFIVRVSRYDFFLDVFVIFSMAVFTNHDIVKNIDLKTIKLWEKFFHVISSDNDLYSHIYKCFEKIECIL